MQAAAGIKICESACSNGRWNSDRSLSDLDVEVKQRKKFMVSFMCLISFNRQVLVLLSKLRKARGKGNKGIQTTYGLVLEKVPLRGPVNI